MGKGKAGEEIGAGMKFEFIVEEKTAKRQIVHEIRGAILCGYTGRDQSAVRKHIEELKKEGVDPPPSVPTFYPKPPKGLTFEEAIQVEGRKTSGEIEFFLLVNEDAMYVGLGSDHTDRELERMDILKSKQVCPTILSRTIWNYEEIKDNWDKVEIRSWAFKDGQKGIYQDSNLETILPPEDLIRLVQQQVKGTLGGIAIFSGTPPLVSGEMIFADRFEGEVLDTILNRKITLGYNIHTLDWFRA